MQGLDWKVKRLEEKMRDVSISGTTRIDPDCLSERERVLFNKVWEIRDKYAPSIPPDDVLAEHHELFLVAYNLIVRRTVDLFVTVMPEWLGGNEIEGWYFKLHFYNFMEDLADCLRNVRKWSEEDRAEFLGDMKESDMMNKAFRFPRGWSEEDKQNASEMARGDDAGA